MPYKLLIVEDQRLSRQLFQIMLQDLDYEIVDSIADASFAEMYCKKFPIDLIVMDVITKNGSSGLDASEKIKRLYPNTKIMIVTSMPECSYIERAKSIGVESFCYKDFGDMDIKDCIKRTLNGESVYPLESPVVQIGEMNSSEFTPKQIELLRLLVEGLTDRQISDQLCLSVETVHNKVKDLLLKTGFSSRTKLAVAIRDSGFIIN